MTQRITVLALVAALACFGKTADAAGKSFRLAAAPDLVTSGFLRYILPRFSLKTGIRVEIVGAALGADADAVLERFDKPPDRGTATPVLRPASGGAVISLAVRKTPAEAHAARFRDWLRSRIGRRTISRFRIDGKQAYATVGDAARAPAPVAPKGDVAAGAKLAQRLCGRCHVVRDRDRFAGIGSTPSFGALRSLPRWQQRFAAFWTLNPHPSFTQVKGMTEPFDPARPPPIVPLVMTLDEVEAIIAYVHQIKAKDLGAPLKEQ